MFAQKAAHSTPIDYNSFAFRQRCRASKLLIYFFMDPLLPKTKKELQKEFSVFFLLAAFLLSHFLFAYYSRYTADDYSLMALIREKGVARFSVWFYMNHEGCFSTWVYQALLCKSMLFFSKPLVFLLFFLLLSLFCLYKSFQALFFALTHRSERLYSLLFSVLVLAAFYMTTYGVSEAFYWCVGGVYLVFASLFIYAFTTFLLSENKWYLSCCFLAFFLFGMSRLNYAFIAGALIGVFFIGRWVNLRRIEWKYVFALIFLVLGVLIYVVAPGNYIRRGSSGLPAMHTLVSDIKGIFLHFFYIKIKKIPVYLTFLLPAYFVGQSFSESVSAFYRNGKSMRNCLILLGLTMLLLVFVHSVIMALASGANSHDRTILLLDLLFIGYGGAVLFHLGAAFPNFLRYKIFLTVCCIVSSFLLLYRAKIYQDAGHKQAMADDARTRQIQSALAKPARSHADTLFLAPLPTCVMLYDWDIMKLKKDDTGWGGLNNGLMLFYQTPFKIDSGSAPVR